MSATVRRTRPTRVSATDAPDSAAAWRSELAALLAVLLLACAAWALIHGVAVGVYQHFARFGDPPLALIDARGRESQLGHTGYFWSERAVHYRTTLAFATDDPAARARLARDVAQQHPDGVDAWREYTLFMEPFYGTLYRWFGDRSRPLVEFLLLLVPLVHVLGFLPLYAIARALRAPPLTALAAVAVYATSRLGFARLTGSLLLKEDLALLLLLGFFAAHLWAWRRESARWLAAASALLAATLASWHLAQFLLAVILAGGAVARTVEVTATPAHRRWFMPAAYLGAALLAGLTPSLAERAFWTSPLTALLAAWMATEVGLSRWPGLGATGARRLGLLGGSLLVLGAAILLNRDFRGDYAHVGGLFLAKLANGLREPADPERLTFAARVFWAPPFHSPDLAEMWGGLGLHLPAVIAGCGWAAWVACRRATEARLRSFVIAVAALAACWLLAARLGVIFLPLAAVAVALGATRIAARLARPPVVASAALLLVAAANVPVHLADPVRLAIQAHRDEAAILVTSDDDQNHARAELYDWIRRMTPGPGGPGGRPAAFLGDIGLSPQLLLYCQRPIVLNSQFENAPIRDRYQRYLAALFSTREDDLAAFAREFAADFLFIDDQHATGAGPRSLPYVAGVGGPLDLSTNVARLHFAPTTLRHFEPVYENDRYRVFRVVPPGESASGRSWPSRASMWWRLENYTVSEGYLVDPRADRARLAELAQDLATAQREQDRLLDAGRSAGGDRLPPVLDLRRHLVLASIDSVPASALVRQIEQMIDARMRQADPATGGTIGQALAALADGRPDRPGLQALVAGAQADPFHFAVAGQLNAILGRFDAAAECFRQATQFWPSAVAGHAAPPLKAQLADEAVCWLLAAGKIDEARRFAEAWWPELPEAMRRDSFIARVLAAVGDEPIAAR